jgi:Rrf2 family transcriptional regulator, cysteine metabolism repressor
MKISSKGHYGLLALAELVANYRMRRPVQVKEIANNQQIPSEYLGQIMVLLKRGRLVHGSRGPAGGYVLARPPETITVKEVLHVLEGPAIGFDNRPSMNDRPLSPVTQRLSETWARGVKAMEKILEETTLADLCKPEAQALMYYI